MDIEEKFKMDTPIGVLEIEASLKGIKQIRFGEMDDVPDENPPALHVTKEARDQIQAFLEGRLLEIDVPLVDQGTEFQQEVWSYLRSIPYGRTVTALDIARSFGDARVVRAIGSSITRNPLPLIIPCHRVVGKKGQLTSYRWGIWRKRFLIELEHPFKQGVLF